jgi:transcription-repair coupling factor (superfamily II helicase)
MSPVPSLLGLGTPTAGQRHIVWRGLHGAAVALAIAETLEAESRPVAVITRTAAGAEQLARELAFFAPEQAVAIFPDYETLPYEPISPPKDLLADRLAALHRLATGEPLRLIVNAEALLNRLPPPDFVVSRSLELARGQSIDRDALVKSLTEHGYLRVSQVSEPGEIAIRGAVIDIYPAGSRRAVRLDLFDQEIETLRLFDPETQLADTEEASVQVLPAREFPFDQEAIRGFRQRFRERFPSTATSRKPSYRPASNTICHCFSSRPHRCSTTSRKTHCCWSSVMRPTGSTRRASSSTTASSSSGTIPKDPYLLRMRRFIHRS